MVLLAKTYNIHSDLLVNKQHFLKVHCFQKQNMFCGFQALFLFLCEVSWVHSTLWWTETASCLFLSTCTLCFLERRMRLFCSHDASKYIMSILKHWSWRALWSSLKPMWMVPASHWAVRDTRTCSASLQTLCHLVVVLHPSRTLQRFELPDKPLVW